MRFYPPLIKKTRIPTQELKRSLAATRGDDGLLMNGLIDRPDLILGFALRQQQ